MRTHTHTITPSEKNQSKLRVVETNVGGTFKPAVTASVRCLTAQTWFNINVRDSVAIKRIYNECFWAEASFLESFQHAAGFLFFFPKYYSAIILPLYVSLSTLCYILFILQQ